MSRHRLEVADVFRQHEQEFLSRSRLSAPQLRAFRDICACRTAALGSHITLCLIGRMPPGEIISAGTVFTPDTS